MVGWGSRCAPKHTAGLADALVAMPGVAGSVKGLMKHMRPTLITMLWEGQCALCDREEKEAADEGNESDGSMPELMSNSSSDHSDAGSATEIEEEPEPEPESRM